MAKFLLRNADGTVQLDLSSRITKFLGTVTATLGSGSISVPGFAAGRAFYFTFPNSDDANRIAPNVTISGTTLSWTTTVNSAGARIGYGIF